MTSAAGQRIAAALTEVGIPRSAVNIRTCMAVARGHTTDPETREMIADRADRIARPGVGVAITTYPCECIASVDITTDPRHSGTVTRQVTQSTLHECPKRLTPELFYERAGWPLGTRVQHPEKPDVRGSIVKRGGRQWVSRDKLPMVRWDGYIDAVPVPWGQLHRVTGLPPAAGPEQGGT
jgi:hypothetical protein